MNRRRRRLLVPCIVIWGCLAWLATIGADAPVDPVAAAWRHATGRMLLVLVAGAVLVWPTSVLLSATQSIGGIAMESLTIALLLGSAVTGLQLPAGVEPAAALAAAVQLAAWVMTIGGLCAIARSRGGIWPVVLPLAAMVAVLPAAVFLPSPLPLLAGPLSAAWAIGSDHVTPGTLWLTAIAPGGAMAVVWVGACRGGEMQGGSTA